MDACWFELTFGRISNITFFFNRETYTYITGDDGDEHEMKRNKKNLII